MDDEKLQRGLARLMGVVAASPDPDVRAAQMLLLERDVYEATHGAGSYGTVVFEKMNDLHNSGTMSDVYQDRAAAGIKATAATARVEAADYANIEYSKFVLYTQATQAELEVAARKIGINDLDAFLEIWKPGPGGHAGLSSGPA